VCDFSAKSARTVRLTCFQSDSVLYTHSESRNPFFTHGNYRRDANAGSLVPSLRPTAIVFVFRQGSFPGTLMPNHEDVISPGQFVSPERCVSRRVGFPAYCFPGTEVPVCEAKSAQADSVWFFHLVARRPIKRKQEVAGEQRIVNQQGTHRKDRSCSATTNTTSS
jgi:hypothetical protein